MIWMKLPTLSVFGVIGLIVFSVGIHHHGSAISNHHVEQLEHLTGGDFKPDFPGFGLLIISAYCIIAFRMYLQAWALDGNTAFARAISDAPTWKRLTEWPARAGWVALAAYIPEVEGAFGLGVSARRYWLLAVGLLLLWDEVLKKHIIDYSPKDEADLRKNWLHFDRLIFACFVLLWFLEEFPVDSLIGDWGIVLAPLAFFVAVSLAAVQLGLWGRAIAVTLRSEHTSTT